MGNRSSLSFLALALLFAWPATAAQAQEPAPGPVFLVISVTDTFSVDGIKAKGKQAGSETITVMIGTLSSGGIAPTDTAFTPDSGLATIPLPLDKDGNPIDIIALSDNQATIFGSYEVYDSSGEALEPHVMTTSATEVDPEIQAAVVAAASALSAAIAEDPFMTTGEIANIVFQELPGSSDLTLSDVASAIFDTAETLIYTGGEAPLVESDGELFPHAPGSALFSYTFKFDEDGNYELADFCRHVDLVVQESAVDLKKQGVLPVTVLSEPGFAAADVATVTILGVPPDSASLSDVDNDGDSDLVLKFSVPELVGAGLKKTTKSITLDGELDDGSCIVGTSAINTK